MNAVENAFRAGLRAGNTVVGCQRWKDFENAQWAKFAAAAPKVASDTGEGLLRDIIAAEEAGEGWGDVYKRAKAFLATPTDATDGATGGGIRINGQPATADDVIAIGRQMDAEDGGYPTTTGAELLEQAARECQAVWRCAIGDFVGALDVLKNEWKDSRRKPERIAGEKLAAVLDLVWAARSPAPSNYSEASVAGNALIDLVRRALSARNLTEGGEK